MTPKEIKKIAEEYLLDITGKVDPNYSHEFQNFLSWLTKRFYLVEKGKVEKERRYYEVTEWTEGDSISDLMGDIKDTFKQLFGPEIGKEEEE